jgi:hypothetical protein
VDDFYNDEMIQSFSNRKIAQLSDELRYLEIVGAL